MNLDSKHYVQNKISLALDDSKSIQQAKLESTIKHPKSSAKY